jgi:hypothetical protein
MTIMFNKFNRVMIFLAPIVILILIGLTYNSTIRLSPFTLASVNPGGIQKTVELPYLESGWGPADYRLEGSVDISAFGPRSLRFIPDDRVVSLTVNGDVVDLSGIDSGKLQDVRNGFAVDLSDHLQAGSNQVEIVLHDYGGDIGMSIQRGMTDARSLALGISWAVALLLCLMTAMRILSVPAKHGIFYVLIAVGCIVKVGYIFTYNPVDHIWSDPGRHWENGTDLLRMDLMALTDPIGYQLYIGFLAKFTLKIPALVAYCTSLLALIGPWFWYRFFRELQSSKTLALAGWAFLSLLPSWTAIYAYFMQETLAIPLLGAALWATWRCRRKGDVRNFVLMVFLWVASGLTRGIAIPMAAVCCSWLWLAQGQKLPKALYSTLVLLLIMGPLTYRSYQTVNHFAPHGMGHLNVIYAQSGKKVIEIASKLRGSGWVHGFGSPSTGAEPFKPFSDWKTRREGTVRINIDLGKGTEDWSKAKDDVAMSLSDYLWITEESLIFLFFAESWPDNNLARTVDWLGSWMRWLWAPLFLILLIGLAVHYRRFRGNWLLPVTILAWFVVQALIPIAINEGRYRKPFEGLAVAQWVLWVGLMRGALRESAPVDPLWKNLKQRLANLRRRPSVIEEPL